MARSAKEILAEFQANMPVLAKAIPQVTEDFSRHLMPDVLKDGALTTKQKELIALGIAIGARCDYCIAIHVKKCLEAGATLAEIGETCGVAILMGGGPALTYAAFAMKAATELTADRSTPA